MVFRTVVQPKQLTSVHGGVLADGDAVTDFDDRGFDVTMDLSRTSNSNGGRLLRLFVFSQIFCNYNQLMFPGREK